MLYDQPYEDSKRVRVTGPFTVESLSPHRTISVEDKKGLAEHWAHGRSMKVVGPDPGVVGETRRLVSENVTVTFKTDACWPAASATPVRPSASMDAATKACTRDIVLRGRTVSLSFRNASSCDSTRKMK